METDSSYFYLRTASPDDSFFVWLILCSCSRQWRTRKIGNCGALQLEAGWRRASRFGQLLPGWHHVRFSDPNFLHGTDILAIGGHLPPFWPYFH